MEDAQGGPAYRFPPLKATFRPSWRILAHSVSACRKDGSRMSDSETRKVASNAGLYCDGSPVNVGGRSRADQHASHVSFREGANRIACMRGPVVDRLVSERRPRSQAGIRKAAGEQLGAASIIEVRPGQSVISTGPYGIVPTECFRAVY